MKTPPTPTAHELRQIDVLAQCDPRTVLRVIQGRPARDLTASRVREVLARLRREPLAAKAGTRSVA